MAEREIAAVQAAVEGAAQAGKVELKGRWFKISDSVGLMPLMKFAHAASSGMDTSDMKALAATYEMLRDVIDPGEWAGFEEWAVESKAGADDLLPVVQQSIELMTARPTGQPSGSSDGQQRTSASSTGNSSAAPGPVSTGSPRGRRATSSSRS